MSAVLCSDCGSGPAHPRVMKEIGLRYCRQCAEKNAHGYLFRVELDTDKLEALCGPLAWELIARCSA